jgi:flotillin
MYFKALPEVVKNAATPLAQVDKITMYGEGNSSKLVGDIIGSTTKITDGLTEATGVDIRALLAGFLGGKVAAPRAAAAPAANTATTETTVQDSDDTDGYYYTYDENRDTQDHNNNDDMPEL